MIDENAFGLLLSYYAIEDDEYGLEREGFVLRFDAFRNAVIECLESLPLGKDVRAIDLGHAVYVEVAEGDETQAPIAWLKSARARLRDHSFETVCILSHGSRWTNPETGPTFSTDRVADVTFITISRPNEAFRRALYADAASRPDEGGEGGWGPGLYLDTEAVEALGRTPKNQPTILVAGGASFYRAGG